MIKRLCNYHHSSFSNELVWVWRPNTHKHINHTVTCETHMCLSHRWMETRCEKKLNLKAVRAPSTDWKRENKTKTNQKKKQQCETWSKEIECREAFKLGWNNATYLICSSYSIWSYTEGITEQSLGCYMVPGYFAGKKGTAVFDHGDTVASETCLYAVCSPTEMQVRWSVNFP